jgi:hypothetical protein
MSEKRKKRMPRSVYSKIEKRFLDIRFSGVEDAINAQDVSEFKNKRYQSVYGETSFRIKKREGSEPLNYWKNNWIDDLNNYDENETYIGHATLRMYRHYRGKKHHYLITIQDIPESNKND